MIPAGVLKLAQFVLNAGDQLLVPKPSQKLLQDFNSIKKAATTANPNPKFNSQLSEKQIKLINSALNFVLLSTNEGKSLVRDLVTIKKTHNISIRYFMDIPYTETIGDMTISSPNYADAFYDDYSMKREIGIYIKYEKDWYPTSPLDKVIEDGIETTSINSAAARTSLNIFHELLHVWFGYMDFEKIYPTGHRENPEKRIHFDDKFIERIEKYMNEVSLLEDKVMNKQ